jgi:hypothetical protein
LENYAHVKEALARQVLSSLYTARPTTLVELDAEVAAVCQLITAEHDKPWACKLLQNYAHVEKPLPSSS